MQEAHFNLGRIYKALGRYDEAVDALTQSIKIKPDHTDAHLNLGIVYGEKGMIDEAISELKGVTAIEPNSTEAHYGLAVSFGKKGMMAEAISEYEKVIAIDPNNAHAHHNLAVQYSKKGVDSLPAKHLYKAGLLFLEKGKRENALKAYEALKQTKSEKLKKALYEKLHPEQRQKKSEPSKQ